jgi:phytanoyl-CoA hydroxylase
MTNNGIAFRIKDALEAQHINFFNEHGFLHIKEFISRDTVELLLTEVQKVEKRLLQKGVDKVNGIPLKFGKDLDETPLIQRICFASSFSEILHEYVQDPRLQSLANLLGENARVGEFEKDGLVFNHYVRAEQSSFTHMGWHTDSPRDLFLGQRMTKMLNIGTHLDDCPVQQGGLRVLPGTHKSSKFKTLFLKKQFLDHDSDSREVGLDIEAGDLTVHDGDLWHRVAACPYTGEISRRRVMYIPIVTGKYAPKDEDSPTPFYHRFAKYVIN